MHVLRLIEPITAGLPVPGTDLPDLPDLNVALGDARHNVLPMRSAPVPWGAADQAPGLFMVMPVFSGVRTAENVQGWTATLLAPRELFHFMSLEPGLAERMDIAISDVGRPGELGGPPLGLYHLPAPSPQSRRELHRP